MLQIFRQSFFMLATLTLLTGVVYPFLVTGIARAAFPSEAAGSLVVRDGVAVGSTLVGQSFTDPKYFWGRPSATGPVPYNGGASSGSNQGPLNPALHDAVRARIEALRAADPENTQPIPVDLVTASASGLDPHISPAAAAYQAGRVARARGLAVDEVRARVAEHTDGRWLGFLGEPRVNVLELNLALDGDPPGVARADERRLPSGKVSVKKLIVNLGPALGANATTVADEPAPSYRSPAA